MRRRADDVSYGYMVMREAVSALVAGGTRLVKFFDYLDRALPGTLGDDMDIVGLGVR